MASFLTKVKGYATPVVGHLHREVEYGKGTSRSFFDEIVGRGFETFEHGLVSYYAAYYNASRGEAAKWRGVEKTYTAGIAAKIATVLAGALGYEGWWTPHLDTAANAAIGTHFAFLGAKKGSEVAKVSRPPGITGMMEGIGALPAAPIPGDCLNRREINELGRMHAY